MSWYNFTNLTNESIVSNPGDIVCQINFMQDRWLALIIVFVLILVLIIILLQMNYTIYTTLPVAFLFGAMIATVFLAWRCNNYSMINLSIVVILWILTAVFAAIRKMVNE